MQIHTHAKVERLHNTLYVCTSKSDHKSITKRFKKQSLASVSMELMFTRCVIRFFFFLLIATTIRARHNTETAPQISATVVVIGPTRGQVWVGPDKRRRRSAGARSTSFTMHSSSSNMAMGSGPSPVIISSPGHTICAKQRQAACYMMLAARASLEC